MAGSLTRKWMVLCGCTVIVIIALGIALPVLLVNSGPSPLVHIPAKEILRSVPLIDGHNDLPHNLRLLLHDQLSRFNFTANLTKDPIFNCTTCHTDLPRLRAGQVGAQFWVAYVNCTAQYKDAVEQTLEQIDVIKRLIKMYPNDLQFVDSAEGIWDAFNKSKIASLIAVEGGHSINSRLAVLRLMYELGVRYLTLTHTCNTPWATGSPQEGESDMGLTEFGEIVVKEMNRLGMMVDISHVSNVTMMDALNVSLAPVIFSHSSARSICNHHRNVPDDVLRMVKKNNGIVMVNFYSEFVSCNSTDEDNVTIHEVVDHINHIRSIAGVDHIGIGSDFDGIDKVPKGLEDVSKFPDLFDLLEDSEPKWSREDLQKLAGLNFIRVFKDVEKVRDQLKHLKPYEDLIPVSMLGNTECRTDVKE